MDEGFFAEIGVVPMAINLLAAFIGGGYVTTLLTEKWSRKRAHQALIVERTSRLLRTYQFYVRLLRQ